MAAKAQSNDMGCIVIFWIMVLCMNQCNSCEKIGKLETRIETLERNR